MKQTQLANLSTNSKFQENNMILIN